MAHLFVAADGMPEGIKQFEQTWDRFKPEHKPIRLRELKLYDIQHDSRDTEKIVASLRQHTNPQNSFLFDNSLQKFAKRENPIKHGKIVIITDLLANLMRFFGFRPVPKVKPQNFMPPTPGVRLLPIMIADDAFVFNIAEGREEEFL